MKQNEAMGIGSINSCQSRILLPDDNERAELFQGFVIDTDAYANVNTYRRKWMRNARRDESCWKPSFIAGHSIL